MYHVYARARELRDYISPATLVEGVGVKAAEIPTALEPGIIQIA
jgi:hypothetical protein